MRQYELMDPDTSEDIAQKTSSNIARFFLSRWRECERLGKTKELVEGARRISVHGPLEVGGLQTDIAFDHAELRWSDRRRRNAPL